MLIRYLIYSVLILTTSACQSTQNSNSFNESLSGLDAVTLLAEAERAGRLRDQQRLRIKAARIFLLDGEPLNALHALEPLNPEVILGLGDPTTSDTIVRLRAQALLGLDRYNDAEETLTRLQKWSAPDMWLLAEVCTQQGNFSCGADNYILAEEAYGFGSDQLPDDIHERIWLALSRAKTAPQIFTHRYHHAWWLLQEQIRDAGSITGQIQAWQAWQQRYPSHPASIRPPSALMRLNDYQIPSIGFLLPLSGSYASAGRAVRDGLITAYLAEQNPNKPPIKFFDSSAEPVGVLFERALSNGVDVIVGPLVKSKAEKFAETTQFSTVPRLLLNYLSNNHPSAANPTEALTQPPAAANNLFQFGIAIEDEAESLANFVYLQGLDRLLVVHSGASWSERALLAFQKSWPNHITLSPFDDIKDLTGAVGEAMQVAASDTRRREIADVLGQPLEFLPRARRDLDGVVALTTHVEARALVPALKFHFANKLPVFATSQAIRGDQVSDLRGFDSTEMPLFSQPNSAQLQLLNAFNLENSQFADLYALGFDAYHIASWLPLLNDHSQIALSGASGYIWLEPGGKFRRDLPISKISVEGKHIPDQ